jgi:O-antigen ligase
MSRARFTAERSFTTSEGWTSVRFMGALRERTALMLVPGAVSLIAAFEIAHSHSGRVVALLAAGLAVPLLLAHPANGTALGAGLLLALPYWQTFERPQLTVGRLASILALLSVLVAANRPRRHVGLRWHDYAVAGFVMLAAVSLLTMPGPWALTLNSLLGFAFYLSGRWLERDDVDRILWVLLAGGTVAALTVMYEFWIAGHVVFADRNSYYWNAKEGLIFRPGGVLGSPPAAGTVLAMTALAGLPLLRSRRHRLVLVCVTLQVAALALTFTRAAAFGLIAGTVVFLWCRRRLVRTGYVAACIALLAILFVLPRVGQTGWFQHGVLRQGTFSGRVSYWRHAAPLATDSPQHLVFGHGFNSLYQGTNLIPGSVPQRDIAADPEILAHGPHNQYVRSLVEGGLLALSALLAWLGGTVLTGIRAARRTGDAVAAAATGAVTAFAVVSLAGDTLRTLPSLCVLALLSGLVVSRSGDGVVTSGTARVSSAGRSRTSP